MNKKFWLEIRQGTEESGFVVISSELMNGIGILSQVKKELELAFTTNAFQDVTVELKGIEE